jgi:hypothetical protein
MQILTGVGAIILVAGLITYYLLFIAPYENTDDAFIEGHITFVSPRVSGQVFRLGNVNKYPRAAGFKAERLGMANQLYVGKLFAALCVKNGQSAAAVADIDSLRGLIVADVVSIVSTLHRPDELEGIAVKRCNNYPHLCNAR